jgi:hypothetical protein
MNRQTQTYEKFNRTQIYADKRRNKKDAMRIALSDFLYPFVSKKEFPIQSRLA